MARYRRRGRMLALAAYARRKSINKGLLGDDGLWRVVFFVIYGRRLLRKLMGSEPQLLSVEKLEPNQTLIVETVHPKRIIRKGKVRR